MTDVYISSIPTDADMDIIGRCVEANFSIRAEAYPLKHGESKQVFRPLTRKEQEFVNEATK